MFLAPGKITEGILVQNEAAVVSDNRRQAVNRAQ